MIAARNAFLMGGAKLPYDAEIECLESTGAQYIDTGVEVQYITTPSRQVAKMAFTSGGATRQLCGANGFLYMGRNGNQYEVCNNNVAVVDSSFHEFDMTARIGSNLAYSFDGVSYTGQMLSYYQQHRFAVYVFAIGGRDGAAASFFCNARIASYQLYLDSVLVRDFIPVRVGSGSSAVGYLYDRANPDGGPLGNGLYPNAGTGAFVIGPDK